MFAWLKTRSKEKEFCRRIAIVHQAIALGEITVAKNRLADLAKFQAETSLWMLSELGESRLLYAHDWDLKTKLAMDEVLLALFPSGDAECPSCGRALAFEVTRCPHRIVYARCRGCAMVCTLIIPEQVCPECGENLPGAIPASTLYACCPKCGKQVYLGTPREEELKMTTEDRLEKLEREMARLRAELATCVLTRQVEIIDAHCEVRARMVVTENGPTLALSNKFGDVHACLVVSENGSELALSDEVGKALARLLVTDNGPELALSDEGGKVRASLLVADNVPTLALFDEKGQVRATMVVHYSEDAGPGLTLFDEHDKPRAMLYIGKDGPTSTMWNENGQLIHYFPR